jgi:hypothetical protein
LIAVKILKEEIDEGAPLMVDVQDGELKLVSWRQYLKILYYLGKIF